MPKHRPPNHFGEVFPPVPFDAGRYAKRRRQVFRQLGEDVLLLYNPPEAHRTHDLFYRYRPDSDVYYLTGFEEPEAVVLLVGGPCPRFIMFVRPRDPEREMWDGLRAGVEGAVTCYGADEAFPIESFDAEIGRYLEHARTLYFKFGRDEQFNQRVLTAFRAAARRRHRQGPAPGVIRDTLPLLGRMRLVKDADELLRMRRAADIAAEAHLRAMERARPGQYEFEVEAELEYVFRKRGALGSSYTSIVGSGPNATILHYNTNNSRLRDGDLLLIDAGAEYGYYASDITRTFPVGRQFTAAQRDIYDLVLQAQKAAIDAVQPGARFNAYHEVALDTLIDGLRHLRLLSGSHDEIRELRTYLKYYMHRAGHWLGSDVHDACTYFTDETRNGQHLYEKLRPGCVVTVEPGLYFAPGVNDTPEHYIGIGVRIEDDVLVTRTGNEVLTAAVPKEVADIEAIRCAALTQEKNYA
ncbi:aminopeptidase P N-terminal domain-containing protein [Chloracidobacterium aggregatum]|uniref:Xaa-Pro aminopeptidase n=1 Tax=Chloracidobacterium sp. N TaxID=2821540 RepID=A0ABX8B236_9BACT|nr:aminopeptidase P N-terminal domain-containing protein [Chloracidobacterium aggregatum]QUV85010.1 aminopeptidase P N-terminal domain-containing protein [Chloracidobacterium sp. 2]QUV88586.1 aminopeptidase P N-terminal domain-containing protein [Chloracidobacterium sp. S]QUV91508.1 aminopeptidase P N-terminal domain-containing protein [Chloracidobacterium sp. A]QUV94685.1 aminopeptidase P N-terminal domain-containing protein [Chloracidobacterium sp. N]QUV97888.1 aminopeptidase P N-terminal do